MLTRRLPKLLRTPATSECAATATASRCGAGPLFGKRKTSSGIDPQLLDYLFDDGASTPQQATAARQIGDALAESRAGGFDCSEVREVLAHKLCRLLPDLSPDSRDRATRIALRTLEQLATDHAVRVRIALATAIKDIACAPPAVVNKLARDIERCVAEPILRCCAALTDSDLLSIIAGRNESWALSAIAGRLRLSGLVAAALAGKEDAVTTGVLLDNEGAVIPEPTFERLIEAASDHPEWFAKLAKRPALPRRLAVRLATHVDRSVLDILRERPDFDEDTAQEIASAMRRRVDWVEDRNPDETPDQRARRLHRMRLLDETAIGDALSWGETEFVRTALALMASVSKAAVETILSSRDARGITSLCWRAGLSMRCAMQVQLRGASLTPRQILNARRGTDYPMFPNEMSRTLELYGIEGPTL